MTKILTKKEISELPEDERQLYGILDNILKKKKDIEKNILDLGYYLSLAKIMVPYGQWGQWLEENVDFSVKTAQRYIKVSEEYRDLIETEPYNKLNSTQLIALAEVKKSDREEIVNNTHVINGEQKTVAQMSVRELKEVIKEKKKSKKKNNQGRKDIDVQTEKVIDVDFKESHETESTLTEEQKLAQLIKEQQELEQQLKLKQRQAKETKENILRNKKSLDLKVEFEEVIEPFLTLYNLNYNIYLVRNEKVRELLIEKCSHKFIEEIDINNKYDYITNQLKNNKNLLQEEKDFITGEFLKFKDVATKRYKELNQKRYEKYDEYDDEFIDDLQDKINEELYRRRHQESQSNKDLKKEFIIAGYKALAKKYHPDVNQGNAEAEDKFKAIGILKDTFLQQNLLN